MLRVHDVLSSAIRLHVVVQCELARQCSSRVVSVLRSVDHGEYALAVFDGVAGDGLDCVDRE